MADSIITKHYIQTWIEARTRFSNLLPAISSFDLIKKLSGTKNSAGFLMRHICDVELLFAKNIFKSTELEVHAKTVISQLDTGEWTNLEELSQYNSYAFKALQQVLSLQTDNVWSTIITTKEFGTKTKAEAFGRIVSHTAYHAGQLSLTLKYGI